MSVYKTREQDIQEILARNPKAKDWTFGEKFKPEGEKSYRIEVTCNICGHSWAPQIRNLKNGNGCPSCSNLIPKSSEEEAKLIRKVNPQAKNWTFGKKFKTKFEVNYRIEVTCDLCGYFWTPRIGNPKHAGTGCPKCGATEPEREIYQWLLDQGLEQGEDKDFVFQQLIPHIGNGLTLDFYLPRYSFCIEFDGPFHSEPIHGDDILTRNQNNDAEKDRWCDRNSLEMVRIDYTQDLYHELERQVLPLISR